MANNGQTDTAALVAMLSERAAVNVRLALVGDEQQWQLHHGQVTLDDTPLTERVWRYSTASFLELRLPGPTVAALLRGDDQDIHGLHVAIPGPPASSASTSRLRGKQEWDRVTTPWPRTEWTIYRDANTQHQTLERQSGLYPTGLRDSRRGFSLVLGDTRRGVCRYSVQHRERAVREPRIGCPGRCRVCSAALRRPLGRHAVRTGRSPELI